MATLILNGITYGGIAAKGDCELVYKNFDYTPTSGTSSVQKTYTLPKSIDEYDAIVISAWMLVTDTKTEQIVSLIVPKFEYYKRSAKGGYITTFLLNGSINGVTRRLYFGFSDSTHLVTAADRTTSGETPTLDCVYGIKWGNKVQKIYSENYSTEEVRVGTWIDGRPIYQRTYNLPSYTEGVNNFIEHGVTNLDMVLKLFGTCKRGNKRIALPFIHQTTSDWSINVYDADASTGKITFWAGTNNAQNITDIYVTMQYTKSTS